MPSRREFLLSAGSALAAGQSGAPARDDSVSWGMPELIRSDIPKFIDRYIRQPPKPRRANEDVFVSSNLENVFYVPVGSRAVLFDTGYDHQFDHHLENFERLGCDVKKFVAILASHSHVDHTGGLNRARTRLGVPVVAHRNAVEPISKGDLYRTAAIIPEAEGWKFDYPACPVDTTVGDGAVIQVGPERILAYHIPGHNPDCVAYLWRGHFFTGDVLFTGGRLGWSNRRWFSNFADMADTMRRLIEYPVPASRFYPTHGADQPYSEEIPKASLESALAAMEKPEDPCNHTPRSLRKNQGESARIIRL